MPTAIETFLATDAFTFRPPPARDTPPEVDGPLGALYRACNGFVWDHGALHLRGWTDDPPWHDLAAAWRGPESFATRYPAVQPNDIPFAQDCMGDQFLWREGRILTLYAESGELEQVAEDVEAFFQRILEDPRGFLSYNPSMKLKPGELWHVTPPFCTQAEDEERSYRACPALEVIDWHAELARVVSTLEEGDEFEIEIED